VLRAATGEFRVANGGRSAVMLAGGHEVTADVVIAATGMDWRHLDVDSVAELLDRGVYYGAVRSEAARWGGDEVCVVGAGNSAAQTVMDLAGAGARVTMAVRGERLDQTMSAYLVRRIEHHPLVDIRVQAQVTEVHAKGNHLGAVTITDAYGASERLSTTALFFVSAVIRTRAGRPRRAFVSTVRGTCLLVPISWMVASARQAGRSNATHFHWRPASQDCLLPATFAAARPSA
jgi:alkyl hydroperoxide reductase subunit AhpF